MNAVVKVKPKHEAHSADSQSLMRMVETAMSRDGFDVDKLRGLLEIKTQWDAQEARKAFAKDMTDFKANPPEIIKRKLVSFGDTSYKHATLFDVTDAIVEGLASHGFTHRWNLEQLEGGQIRVTCIITHRSGHSESTPMQSSADQSGKKNNIQAIASTVTYLQRYTLLAAVGLATKDQVDDDGKGSEAEYITEQQAIQINEFLSALAMSKAATVKFLEYMKANTVSEILAQDYGKAMNALKTKEKNMKEAKA